MISSKNYKSNGFKSGNRRGLSKFPLLSNNNKVDIGFIETINEISPTLVEEEKQGPN